MPNCLTCGSPSPNLHPAVQHEGEVQPCDDKFHVRAPSSEEPPTPDERACLLMEGFDLDERYPEYGQNALLQAYRAGFHDGLARNT